MKRDNNQRAFFSLVRAGLWEQEARLSPFGKVGYEEVMRLSEEQAVVGLVTAGLEHVADVKVPQDVLLQFIGETIQLEQQNIAMNKFIVKLLDKLREAGIDSVLVKGQGVAQCYERPMWRSCGDIDLLVNDDNYERGKRYLDGIAEGETKEYSFNKEYNTTIGGWCVELHGSLRCGLSGVLNKGVDSVQGEICDNHHVRYWNNGGRQIPLPEENDDVMVIFTHFIKHFYKGELGVRQICDWCRLLWTYRSELDLRLLESRIRKMGLMSEWKAFGAFAVEYLGMPAESMLFYSVNGKWKRKADRICTFVMKVGNLGHNRDMSYYKKCPYLIQKITSLSRRCEDMLCHVKIFPIDSFRFFCCIMFNGIISMIRGK